MLLLARYRDQSHISSPGSKYSIIMMHSERSWVRTVDATRGMQMHLRRPRHLAVFCDVRRGAGWIRSSRGGRRHRGCARIAF